MRRRGFYAAALFASIGLAQQSDAPKKLTLAEAEATALKNHPSVASATAQLDASKALVQQTRAGFYPLLNVNVTGAGVEHNTVITAGTVQTSALHSRFSTGFGVTQLVTDFGRTSALSQTAQLRAGAQGQTVAFTRAVVLLRVRQAFFRALAAQAVQLVARQTVEQRRVTARQVTALAQSNLRSSLDVSFAEVTLSDAELALFRAENDIRVAFADLSTAMGQPQDRTDYALTEEPMPGPMPVSADEVVTEAMRSRADLASLRLARDAAAKFVSAEKKLSWPTVNLIGVAGVAPARDERLRSHYDGAAVNVSIPILNGGLFSGRSAEAEARARAAEQDLRDAELRVARDVKVAWLNAETAHQRLDVTERMFEQAARAARLAQSRYDLGLTAIVELTQSQLNQTTAEITRATARYEYQLQRSVLEYETGALK
jgi:outer membrane protein